MSRWARSAYLTILVGALVVALWPCQAWSEGHWEITDAWVSREPTSQSGYYEEGPFDWSFTSSLETCTQPLESIGTSSFESASACDIAVFMRGSITTGQDSYSGNRGVRNWTDCQGEYFFTWEDDPPSTSPGILLHWDASGGGSVAFTAGSQIAGNASVRGSADAYHSGGGNAPNYYYDEDWPGGWVYADGYVQTDPETTTLYGAAWGEVAPSEHGYWGGYGPGSSSVPTEEYTWYPVAARAGWYLEYFDDDYLSDPGVQIFRVDSAGGCDTFAAVTLSVGPASYGLAEGEGIAAGNHSFGAEALTP